MFRVILVALVITLFVPAPAPAQRRGEGKGKAGPPPVVSPEVKSDRTVVFRLNAPKASEVFVVIEGGGARKAMTKGEKSAVTVQKGENFHLGFGILIYCTPANTRTDIETAYQDYLKVK